MHQKLGSHRWHRRAASLLLALVMVLDLAPGLPLAAGASAHWSDPYLSQMVEWGFIRADQAQKPDELLTRADFMSIVNRAYGYHEPGETPFEDVVETDWFYDDVGIAYTARYIKGTSPTTASPGDTLTRETAATILGRNMMLQESAGEILDFSDAREISSWARGTIKSSLEHYLVDGYDDGTFRPQKDLSWGEMASMVTRIVGTPIQEEGDYALGGVFGNVTISSPGVTLRDTIISGDLYVTGGVGLGNVKLENVNVLGRIIVSGTGESETGEASIVLRNVTADEMLVDNLQGNFVSVRADGITEIGLTTVRTSAYVEDNTPEGLGLKYISLEGRPHNEEDEDADEPIQLDLAGRIGEVVNKTPESQVRAAKGTVAKLTVDEAAVNSTVIIDRGAVIKELNLDVGTSVSGEGDIEKLVVNAPGSTVTMLPDQITIRPGITATINGQEMDNMAAEESSKEPLILAGYPRAEDIAPNSLKAVFSTNKRGTIYWAVSAITDGSVSADDLIKPPAYGSIAVRSGTTPAPQGNTEVSAAISGLTPGGSYYLSAVLVDERDQRSPTKVISFTLPDNTVPAFCTGYPYMSRIEAHRGQVTVMPTKSCILYYALMAEGAQAPTADELKTSSVSGALGYGVREVTKNLEDVFFVNDVTLEEQKTYVLYLWLTDANGANSSAVISLTFTTVDETPPEFLVNPTVNNVQATSVGLTFRLNEDGIVYWAVVPAGTEFPKPRPGETDILLTDEYAILQVTSGLNALRYGQVNAREGIDGNFTVTGLQPESAYDLYYVAKDKAGNYSITVVKMTINTLDTNGPIVKQYFTKYSGLDNTANPMADTDIILEFSENVRSTVEDGGESFLTLYEAVENAATASQREEAINKLTASLYGSIRLYRRDLGAGKAEEVPSNRTAGATVPSDCVLDYTKATVKAEDGKLLVTFPHAGLVLDSGTTYYFQITNMTDTSNAMNAIIPTTVDYNAASVAAGHKVPTFTIVFAEVYLSSPGVGGADAPYIRKDDGTVDPDAGGKFTPVDLSFQMTPLATSTVDRNISYDVHLWSDTILTYQLFYRITNSKGMPVTGDAAYAGNLLPSRYGNTVDPNGWVYLGKSGAVNPSEGEWAGKSVNGHFNQCDEISFPALNSLNEDLRYEFVITLNTIGTSDDRRNWNGEVNFQVYVAAGWSNSLSSLANGLNKTNWERFKATGLSGGIVSIGRNDDGEDWLDIFQLYTDTALPSFINGAPSFTVTDTTSLLQLTLDRKGTIYYAVAPAEGRGGLPDITTTVPADGLYETIPDTDTRYIVKSEVPLNGGTGQAQPTLIRPDRQNIFAPAGWTEASSAVTGNITHPGVVMIEEEITGLQPETTYYAYFVLKGAGQELSQVYIYQFTTSAVQRPKINLNPNVDGEVEITTDVPSDMDYRVYSITDAALITRLGEPFKNYVDPQKPIPPAYLKKTDADGKEVDFTVLDAMIQSYSWTTAHSNIPDSDTTDYFFPTDANKDYRPYEGGYSVFDIYANQSIRTAMASLIRTETGIPVGAAKFVDNATIKTPLKEPLEIKNLVPGTVYLILTVAKNQNADPTAPSYVVDSFKAYQPVEKIDQVPPKLIAATTYVEKQTDGSYKANVELTFDKNVYWKQSNSSDPQIVDSLTKALDGHKSIVDDARGTPPFASITANGGAGPAQSFNIEITGLKESGTVNILPNGFISNVSGQSTTDKITIGLVSGTYVHPVTGATITGPYAVVSWGGTPVNPIEFTNPGDPEKPGEEIIEFELRGVASAASGADTDYEVELDIGQSVDVTVLVTNPPTASDKNADIVWAVGSSSPATKGETVVKINGDSDNRVRSLYAESPGEAVVRVRAGADVKTVKVKVKTPVLQNINLTVPNGANYKVEATSTGAKITVTTWVANSPAIRVTASLNPAQSVTDSTTVTWSSSNSGVAAINSVDNTGAPKGDFYADLTIAGTGQATITVASGSKQATLEVDVQNTRSQSGITINKTKPIPR